MYKTDDSIKQLLYEYNFEDKMNQLAKRLHDLTLLEENEQTSYTGADLNLLERLQDKIANETITQRDILEIEKLAFKFL